MAMRFETAASRWNTAIEMQSLLNAQLGQSIRHCQSRDHQFLKRNLLLLIGCGDFASLFRGHYHMDSSHNATEENALQDHELKCA